MSNLIVGFFLVKHYYCPIRFSELHIVYYAAGQSDIIEDGSPRYEAGLVGVDKVTDVI